MTTELKCLIAKIDEIKNELDYIKENMVETDNIMTLDDFEAYKRSFDKKNLVSFEDAKKQLGF